jgi:hypothetical protein
VNRRYFLLTGLLVAAGTSTAGLLRWLKLRPVESSSTPENDAPEKQEATAPKPKTPTSPDAPVFPEEDHIYLLSIADVIVPREGDLPAASEIDIIARLEVLAHSSKSRLRLYRNDWPKLRKLLNKVPMEEGKLDKGGLERRMQGWLRNYREKERVFRKSISFLEVLRRDILMTYYSTPAGWAAVGYTGPIHRMNPAEGDEK